MKSTLRKYRLQLVPGALIVVTSIFAIFTMARDDHLVNVGFLLVGALLSVFTTTVVEANKRGQQAKDLARVLYEELSDRVARCCFDFEAPWSAYCPPTNKNPNDMDIFRMRKFAPNDPIVYQTSANQLALLSAEVPQAILHFYYRLSAWQRDINNLAANTPPGSMPLASNVRLLAQRLSETLAPGLRALEVLAPYVDDHLSIEAAAIAGYDASRRTKDARTLRERLKHFLQ